MKKTVLEKSVGAVSKVKKSIFESISMAMDLADWATYLKENQDIALKINLGWDMFIPGSITSPMVTGYGRSCSCHKGILGFFRPYHSSRALMPGFDKDGLNDFIFLFFVSFGVICEQAKGNSEFHGAGEIIPLGTFPIRNS